MHNLVAAVGEVKAIRIILHFKSKRLFFALSSPASLSLSSFFLKASQRREEGKPFARDERIFLPFKYFSSFLADQVHFLYIICTDNGKLFHKNSGEMKKGCYSEHPQVCVFISAHVWP